MMFAFSAWETKRLHACSSGYAAATILLCSLWLPLCYSSRLTSLSETYSGDRVPVTVSASGDVLSLQNGYVSISFNLKKPSLSTLAGDWLGNGVFEGNLLSRKGICLEREDTSLVTSSSTDSLLREPLPFQILENTTDRAVVLISNILDTYNSQPFVNSSWTLSLQSNERSVNVAICATMLVTGPVTSIRIGAYFKTLSSYGMFDSGVVQMMASRLPLYPVRDHLKRFYSLGQGCVDITDVEPEPPQGYVVISSVWDNVRSGMQFVLVGSLKEKKWLDGWESAELVTIEKGKEYSTSFSLAANLLDFPVQHIPTNSSFTPLSGNHTRALYTAVYGSPSGALVSLDWAPEGRISPCVAHPDRCYDNTFNFFDPDSYLSISALLYSGDPILIEESIKLIETTGGHVCLPGMEKKLNCSIGQIPHHFVGKNVTFRALSGATQTGPNIFWTLSALQVAKATANVSWIDSQLGRIRLSLNFLLHFFNATYGLINAPGSLWVDTFIRRNFTSDSNAMMVHLLREMSALETFVGNSSGADLYAKIADMIVVAMNKYLWQDDHYVTQLTVFHNGSHLIRDFVDYDANLLAVAFGVSDMTRSRKILQRVDSGQCTHRRPTWVSEKFYDRKNCNINNIGDSAVSMGRIGWADARARKQMAIMGDSTSGSFFESVLLQPILDELLENVWMYERYQCEGNPTHNNYYIEYPEVIAMMLREVYYGIEVGLVNVTIQPVLADMNYTYQVRGVSVNYDSHGDVTLELGVEGERMVTIGGLANDLFNVTTVNKWNGWTSWQLVGSCLLINGRHSICFNTTVGSSWRINVRPVKRHDSLHSHQDGHISSSFL